MTEQNKQLLLRDLSARLPYGVKINRINDYTLSMEDIELNAYHLGSASYEFDYRGLRPYLRPMSSMTEEERKELSNFAAASMFASQNKNPLFQLTREALLGDLFNKHHIDYRGLIEKGLALEAKEGMYNKN